MRNDYRKTLIGLGFGLIEVGIIEFVLLRMGVTEMCEHTRPRFVECYPLDTDPAINEARWQKFMRETGFQADAIKLAERGIFGNKPGRC